MSRVAVIDDIEDNRAVLATALEMYGHKVQSFSHADQFLEIFDFNAFDVVLLDVVLPDVDGYDVLEAIRNKDARVPVIAITAQAYEADRRRAMTAGFTAFIVKPVLDFEKLHTQISGWALTARDS